MKNRKQKVVQPKKILVLQEETNINPSSGFNYKQTSGHTKMSTNCTIHSSVGPHPTIQKSQKNKKNSHSASKDNTSQPLREHSAKSNIKLKCLNMGLGVDFEG